MKKILFVILVLGFTFSVNAQFRRIALLEEATNASCSPCASANPKLQQFFEHNFGGVISVRYHAWWPGTDPMYSENTADNSDRINYYGINGVPTYMMDGAVKGMPNNPVQLANEMWNDISTLTPLWVNVTASANGGNYDVTVKIISSETIDASNLYLRTAVIERRVHYNSPPGSNGEKDFNDVMRKLLPTSTGEALTAITSGDTLTFTFSTEVQHSWNVDDLAAVAWIQNDNTKEVLQSNISVPTFIIKSDRSNAELLDSNQVVNTNYMLANNNPDTLSVHLTTESILANGWTFALFYNGSETSEINATVLPGDTLFFSSELSAAATGNSTVGIYAQNLNDAYQYGFTATYSGFILGGDVLLVDADGANFETNYETGFDSAKVKYTFLDRAYLSTLGTDLLSYGFKAVYWNAGWGFPAFVPADIDFLTQYLDGGGNLFIGGQDIGWDVWDPSGSSGFQAAKDFYNNYLGASYLADNSGINSMTGVSGDPISDGLSFSINSVYSRYPEQLRPHGANASKIFEYTNSTKIGGVKNDDETYKTVYLGVGLEQVSSVDVRLALVKNSLVWFGVLQPNGIDDENKKPLRFNLSQNYPNPFNPTTTISYSVPSVAKGGSTFVNLSVFDILGRKVATLVNRNQTSGDYRVRFDGSKLASGVYFFKLNSGDISITKKMELIK